MMYKPMLCAVRTEGRAAAVLLGSKQAAFERVKHSTLTYRQYNACEILNENEL